MLSTGGMLKTAEKDSPLTSSPPGAYKVVSNNPMILK